MLNTREALSAWKDNSNLNDLLDFMADWATEKGWNDDGRTFGDLVALMHSELSEALEEFRNEKPDVYRSPTGKPEGKAVELIDCVIRILHYFAMHNIDITEVLYIKLLYNLDRPHRHGGKVI